MDMTWSTPPSRRPRCWPMAHMVVGMGAPSGVAPARCFFGRAVVGAGTGYMFPLMAGWPM